MKKLLILLAFLPIAQARAEFPSQQVEYTCSVALYYIAYEQSACILEQFNWYDEAVQSPHYQGALWYGQRRNWRGDIVGIDFKKVLDRVKYLDQSSIR